MTRIAESSLVAFSDGYGTVGNGRTRLRADARERRRPDRGDQVWRHVRLRRSVPAARGGGPGPGPPARARTGRGGRRRRRDVLQGAGPDAPRRRAAGRV